MELSIPTFNGTPLNLNIEPAGSLVFVGANGTGKSRLGQYLDVQLKEKSYRVPAQKNLQMSGSVSVTNIVDALKNLLYGNVGWGIGQKGQYKLVHQLTSDYDKLMIALFSLDNDHAIKYRAVNRTDPAQTQDAPQSALERLVEIWNDVLPHRQLVIHSAALEVKVAEGTENYKAEQLSDGERAILYMLGQCLLAPSDCVIILDEPEVHIHRSILKKLWDEIESARPDCGFIYITHDLEFAQSRPAAQKFSLSKFEPTKWEVEEIGEDQNFNEDMLGLLLGSRRPVLFVEGTGASIDSFLYGQAYPDYLVIACGSASDVIHAVSSFKAHAQLHHNQCAGIIDRDDRTDEAVRDLQSKNVFPLQYTEVENVLLQTAVLKIVGEILGFDEQARDAIVEAVIATTKEQIVATKERHCLEFAKRRVDDELKRVNMGARTIEELSATLSAAINGINVTTHFEERKATLDSAVADNDFDFLIRIFDNKGIIRQIGRAFGLQANGYVETVFRLLKAGKHEALLIAIKSQLPVLTLSEPVAAEAASARLAEDIAAAAE